VLQSISPRVPGWNVIGASRRTAQDQKTLQHLSVDLLDPKDCTAKFSELHDITHLIFAAYAERPTPPDLVKVNVALLQNLLDAGEPSSPHLRHVTLYQGGKAYGCHLGPFKTPAREDDSRYLGVNFYYDQEDLLRTRQLRANWSWTVLARYFDMPCGDPLPLRLTEQMAVRLLKAYQTIPVNIMNLQLEDKTALVSGSSQGIGFAIAEALAKESRRQRACILGTEYAGEMKKGVFTA
jgi:hypothetical protein